jgi:hypothetical protein
MGIELRIIPSFESMERESRATTWKKMKDCHMQGYVVGEWLFVGRNVEIAYDDDHVLRDGVSNRIVHKRCDDKDVHPHITIGEDGQFGTIALVDHNLTNQQIKSYPKLQEDTQF